MSDLSGLKEIVAQDRLFFDEPMSSHTSFRVGGPAEVFADVSRGELPGVLAFAKENDLPVTVIGNGSNLLVSDRGLPGIVICIAKGMDEIRVDEEARTIRAGAGALLSSVASRALDASLSGMEFASGIPGSVGGGVIMNAGAYGGEIRDILLEAEVLENGSFSRRSVEELDLSYRHSSLMGTDAIVTEAVFRLEPGDRDEIAALMNDLNGRRREKQPLNYPSAGSTFKRPEGYFAGKLIQDAGLKGFSIGGAQVSEKHSGFVINTGDATAADIYALIGHVRETVLADSGVTLEPEVRLLGEF